MKKSKLMLGNAVEICLIFCRILGPLVSGWPWAPNHFVLGAQLAPGEKRLVCIPDNGHYLCENSLKEVQGATTSSHILPSLLQEPWPCIQLLCAERHVPCQKNLATDQDEPAVQ